MIIDDEHYSRALLKHYIDKIPLLSLTTVCNSALDAYSILQETQTDLLFLDIQMPEMNGIEFLNTIPLSQRPLVVFVSGHAEYAIEGYNLDVVDFLHKPFDFGRFVSAVNKAFCRMHSAEAIISGYGKNTYPIADNYLIVRSAHKIFRIKLDEIEFIQGMKEYVAFVFSSRKILALQSLKVLMRQLPGDRFVRIHRSFIVPIQKVQAVDGNHLHVGNRKLPLGGRYRETALQKIF